MNIGPEGLRTPDREHRDRANTDACTHGVMFRDARVWRKAAPEAIRTTSLSRTCSNSVHQPLINSSDFKPPAPLEFSFSRRLIQKTGVRTMLAPSATPPQQQQQPLSAPSSRPDDWYTVFVAHSPRSTVP